MLVKVKLLGSGTQEDPFRYPLPTYHNRLMLHDQRIGYAVIPDTDHPDLHEHESAKVEQTDAGHMLVELDDAGHKEWHNHLDERYQERKGEFRPEIAQ